MRRRRTVIEQLAEFIEYANRPRLGASRWLDDEAMRVYVRRSIRPVGRNAGGPVGVLTLDIASITVFDRGHGTGGRFFKEAHSMNPWHATYFESVLNEGLGQHLLKNGYTIYPDLEPPCYYKHTGR